MNNIPLTQTSIALAVAVTFVLIASAIWFYNQRRRSQRLQQRFGPEYRRTVDVLGSKSTAESELLAREKRVERLNLLPLEPAEAVRFTQAWKALQVRFVDNPKGVVMQADQLVRELMAKRGYPMGDFEHRAADISVDHPSVVEHYRAAQTIAVRDGRGEANTEELRQAVVHYRVLFDELLEVRNANGIDAPAPQVAAHS